MLDRHSQSFASTGSCTTRTSIICSFTDRPRDALIDRLLLEQSYIHNCTLYMVVVVSVYERHLFAILPGAIFHSTEQYWLYNGCEMTS